MKSPLPRDPALPYLAAALDETAMAAVFSDVLRSSGTRVDACRIEHIEYRPRRHCLVSYVLAATDARGRHEQRVAARVCAHGESARHADKAALFALKASRSGPALVHLAELDMVTMWWPNDARLDAPRVFADEHLLRGAVLPEVLAALEPRPCRLESHRVEIVHYAAETRLAARVTLAWRAQADPATRHERVLFARAERANRGATTHAVMRALQASAPWQADELRTPRSVLWQEAFGLHWLDAAPGRPLPDLQRQVHPAASLQLGMQLAALHGVAVPIERVVTGADLKKRPHEFAALLGEVDRSWMQPLLRLALRLEQGIELLEDSAIVTLLGDLQPRNVRVDGAQRLTFVGLDSVQRGPAALDLGAWIAETLHRALLEGDVPRQATPIWQGFLAGYAAGGGEYVAEPVLAWATAYHLCQCAWRSVTQPEPGHFALVPRLIALAEAIAHAGTPRAGDAGVPELNVQHRETTA